MFAKFSPDGSRVGYVRENNSMLKIWRPGELTDARRIEANHQWYV
jgi:hypothetical protein